MFSPPSWEMSKVFLCFLLHVSLFRFLPSNKKNCKKVIKLRSNTAVKENSQSRIVYQVWCDHHKNNNSNRDSQRVFFDKQNYYQCQISHPRITKKLWYPLDLLPAHWYVRHVYVWHTHHTQRQEKDTSQGRQVKPYLLLTGLFLAFNS